MKRALLCMRFNTEATFVIVCICTKDVFWVFLYQTYCFYPNLCIWLVAMPTERLNFAKKTISSEAIWGIKLKLGRNVHNLAATKILFLLPLLMIDL